MSIDSRAHAQSLEHPLLESVDERVTYIEGLMAEDVWNAHTSKILRRALSARWGVVDSTIGTYSTAAGKAIDEALQEQRRAIARRRIARLEYLADLNPYCEIPGIASAAVKANEVLLRATGYAEPEEDKQRPTTLVQVGHVVTSPVFAGLLAGKSVPKLNGESSNDAAHLGEAEESSELPADDRLRALVRKAPHGD